MPTKETGSSVNAIEDSGDSVDPETGLTDATASDLILYPFLGH